LAIEHIIGTELLQIVSSERPQAMTRPESQLTPHAGRLGISISCAATRVARAPRVTAKVFILLGD
jgi:hypothetical protein